MGAASEAVSTEAVSTEGTMPIESDDPAGAAHRFEATRLELLRAKQELRQARVELELLRQQRAAAEERVAKTRGMLSFQLGYALLHGFKSWRGLFGLPRRLFGLWGEARRRQRRLVGLGSPLPALTLRSRRAPTPALAPLRTPPAFELPPGKSPAERLRGLVVASILDEFTHSAFGGECQLLTLTPSRWKAQLEARRPDLLLVESAWFGLESAWQGKVNHVARELVGVVEWCRTEGVPSLFWNKEDPVHFETFLSAAQLFDYVFTTDIDCIHRYKAALGHERVYLLPFACQPRIHHPIATLERKPGVVFAGAYYVRYPERARDLGNLVSAMAELGPVDIYDRNYGKAEPNYQFPEEYRPFIVGHLPFAEIDRAYKGYELALNLNSIKQSQSMFARRVFELLASGTLVLSNYSRGLRLFFGELVLATDSPEEAARRVRELRASPELARRVRVAGLRKVLLEHCYQDRFATMVGRVQGSPVAGLLPSVVLTGYAESAEELEALRNHHARQEYEAARLVVVLAPGVTPPPGSSGARAPELLLDAGAAGELRVGDAVGEGELVLGMSPYDYYGPTYALELALATRYSDAGLIGKLAHYERARDGALRLVNPGEEYRAVASLPARAALVRRELVAEESLLEWARGLSSRSLASEGAGPAGALAIDPLGYCRDAGLGALDEALERAVDAGNGLDGGLSLSALQREAEGIAPEVMGEVDCPELDGRALGQLLAQRPNPAWRLTGAGSELEVESLLEDEAHEYLYASRDVTPEELGFGAAALFHLELTPGLQLQLVVQFLDAQKQRIGATVLQPNRNQEAMLPTATAWLRLGFRLYGSGRCRVRRLLLGHRMVEPALVLGRGETLVLTNHYPSPADLYRNAFVHSRVLGYARQGVRVDVFRLRPEEPLSFYEHEGVDVISGPATALRKLLESGRYRRVFVHFLSEAMWQVLAECAPRLPVCAWLHGAEIHAWHRRHFNHQGAQERELAKLEGERRRAFWRPLLRALPDSLRLVFVSEHFAREVMEDLELELPRERYAIIHNPIDTARFRYLPKPAEQRKRILLLRPFASRQYANDLAVAAILALQGEPFFRELHFRVVGAGRLFDEVTQPLRALENVVLDQRFLPQAAIAELHRDYGLFLCPTRWDSQGVSRDEAMASGLVPLTNRVAAVPEFVDDGCAVLAPPEDHLALAEGIARLCREPERFLAMSKAAAERVRARSDSARVLRAELEWGTNE